MARDRQRSKQRQQQRREERLAQRGEPVAGDGDGAAATPKPADGAPATPPPAPADGAAAASERELEEQADLEVGAPPEDIGRSDRTLRDEPPAPSFATDDEELADDPGDDLEAFGTRGPRGVKGGREGADPHKRGRLVAFLVAVWAELQRVQWPDRRQLTQLTGVVLFFVLIVGAYLGGLDAIFSKLIQAIL
jgi:preprotein translocase subunit SecE